MNIFFGKILRPHKVAHIENVIAYQGLQADVYKVSNFRSLYSLMRLYSVIGPTGKALYHNRQLMLVNNAALHLQMDIPMASTHYHLDYNSLITATVDCLLYRVSHTLIHRWFWMLSANETLSRIVWMSIR